MGRVAERAPLLIGVTGSRFFDRFDAASDRAAARLFERRLSVCLAFLDRQFPHCPKVLVCGAAFGVDLVAARAALARGPHWSVAALLPFARELFAEDFAPAQGELEARWDRRPGGEPGDGGRDAWMDAWMDAWTARYAEHRAGYEALLAAGPGRVLVRVLPRLARGGVQATDAELSRHSPTRDAALRREHYEQVGQWIAEAATVLFAYTSEPDGLPSAAADGGTARVVARRRVGRPDRAGLDVARRSAVLRHDWSEVLRSHGRDVWLVKRGPLRGEEGDLPIAVLGRRSAFDSRPKWNAFSETSDMSEDEVGADAPPTTLDTLVVPRLIDGLHRRSAASEAADGHAAAKGRWAAVARRFRIAQERVRRWRDPAEPVATPACDPRTAIGDLRRRLGAVQGRAKQRSERASAVLAVLFVGSVALFELFADLFADERLLLACYTALVAISGAVVAGVGWRRWQPLSEDCRSISEMLRVQGAWWAAGLGDRVDREHLQGVGRDLAHIPETVTTLLAWIWLKGGWAGDEPRRADGSLLVDWAAIHGSDGAVRTASGRSGSDWIGGQCSYFARRIPIRDVRAHRARVGSLFLFTTAWWLALIVAALFHARPIVAGLNGAAPSLRGCGLTATACVLAAIVIVAGLPLWWRLRGPAVQREIRATRPGGRLSAAGAARTFGLPLVSAVALAFFAFAATPTLTTFATSVSNATVDGYRWIALVLVAVLIAVSGAWRYMADKSACEAEALEYRDAQRRFDLAAQALSDDLDGDGVPTDLGRAQAIVKELGRLALVENEAWLKSRRERPLTTV